MRIIHIHYTYSCLTLLVDNISDIETFAPGRDEDCVLECAEFELTAALSGAVNSLANVGLKEVLVLCLGVV